MMEGTPGRHASSPCHEGGGQGGLGASLSTTRQPKGAGSRKAVRDGSVRGTVTSRDRGKTTPATTSEETRRSDQRRT